MYEISVATRNNTGGKPNQDFAQGFSVLHESKIEVIDSTGSDWQRSVSTDFQYYAGMICIDGYKPQGHVVAQKIARMFYDMVLENLPPAGIAAQLTNKARDALVEQGACQFGYVLIDKNHQRHQGMAGDVRHYLLRAKQVALLCRDHDSVRYLVEEDVKIESVLGWEDDFENEFSALQRLALRAGQRNISPQNGVSSSYQTSVDTRQFEVEGIQTQPGDLDLLATDGAYRPYRGIDSSVGNLKRVQLQDLFEESTSLDDFVRRVAEMSVSQDDKTVIALRRVR